MAKWNLGKVRLKPMRSAVFRLIVRDLRSGPMGIAGLLCIVASHVLYCQQIIADLFALCVANLCGFLLDFCLC